MCALAQNKSSANEKEDMSIKQIKINIIFLLFIFFASY